MQRLVQKIQPPELVGCLMLADTGLSFEEL